MSNITPNNKISITEIYNGRKLSMQFYGPHSLKRNLIQQELSSRRISFVYAYKADVLNVAENWKLLK